MIKLTLPDNIKDSGLSLPGSTPKTLVEISSESLPYACQCPLCGGLFEIPEGLLYKIEEDELLDGEFGADIESNGTDINIDMPEGSDSDMGGPDMVAAPEAGDLGNDTAV